MIDTIRGLITYITAALVVMGVILVATLTWLSPTAEQGGRDIAILLAFLGPIAGAAAAFMWQAESAKQATKAAERSQAASDQAHAANGSTPGG